MGAVNDRRIDSRCAYREKGINCIEGHSACNDREMRSSLHNLETGSNWAASFRRSIPKRTFCLHLAVGLARNSATVLLN